MFGTWKNKLDKSLALRLCCGNRKISLPQRFFLSLLQGHTWDKRSLLLEGSILSMISLRLSIPSYTPKRKKLSSSAAKTKSSSLPRENGSSFIIFPQKRLRKL